MRYYTIITDSSCDLPASLAEKLGIRVVPLSVFVEGKQYYNYLDGRDISNEEFYGQLVQGKMVTTSAVNVEQFKMVMESELLTGHDVADGLTTTEFAIAMLAARDWTTREIAGHLNISTNTAKRHISEAMKKLKVKNRKDLKQYMLR